MSRIKLSAKQLTEEPWKRKIITPRVASTGIVESPDRKSIILIERKYEPYGLAFPGGMIEVGETVKDAVIREVKEETGIDARVIGLINVSSEPDNDPRWHVVIFYFVMITSSKKEPVGGDDAKKAFWVDLNDLNKYENDMVKTSINNLIIYKKWRETGLPKLLDIDLKV